ncbi:MAG: FadR family transcriptional regulator [Syntrophomonadaceae bacterium]|nr:FadR family transcriptional regulator [Syntrophomonadaceae bacterium]
MQIEKTNVTQQVIEYLKTNIENENWKVGKKIPSENMLTNILGVSRASIRVAIQQFIAINTLESIHGKGTFVKSNDLSAFRNSTNNITREDCQDINKVLEFRRIIETESCYLAAKNAARELIESLKKCLALMAENIGNPEEFVKADIMFHEEICRASGNHLLEKSLREVFKQTVKNHKQINEIFGYKDGMYYHRVILKAIEEKNAKLAKRLMHDHLQQAIDKISVLKE